MRALDGKNILLGVTGGIAAYKSACLARELMRAGASVTTVLTGSAERFITPLTFEALTEKPCRTDADMFAGIRGQTHVSLARGLDLMLIAPATATTLARLSCGSGDNLLSATALAASCPIVVSPAMHTQMWLSTPVQRNVDILRGFPGYSIVPPDQGVLASGDEGPGRFPPTERILQYCAAALTPQSLNGRIVVVTAGPTREHIDPVRVITNPSTGLMGIALAEAAARRGASVRLVIGPCPACFDVSLPGGPHEVTRVETTSEMLATLDRAIENADALVMAAAPADERPAVAAGEKIAKDHFDGFIATTPNPDILATLAPRTAGLAVMAFAAETTVTPEAASAKMLRKGADLLFANPAGGGRGFGDVPDGGILVRAGGPDCLTIPEMPKPDLADVLMDELAGLVERKRG